MPQDSPPQLQVRKRRPTLRGLACTALGLLLLGLSTLGALCVFPVVYLQQRLVTKRSPQRIGRHFIWVYGRIWMLVFRPLVRFRVRMPPAASLPRPCIAVCNHLSIFDIYFLAALPVSDVAMVVRSWPFRMFWSRPFMRLAGYLDIEGSTPQAAARQLGSLLEQGVVLVFFPEGHRSRDGQLQRFRSGAFKLALERGLPVLPLCITGTDQLLPPGQLLMHPAVLRIHALEPVDPAPFSGELGHIALRKHVKALMARELERMRALPETA